MTLESCIARLPLDWEAIEAELVSHLSALIQLDTTNPPGNEIAVARYLAAQLATDEITSTVLEAAPGRANLIARLAGTGRQAPLMLLGHADVVGAVAANWTHPPFSGLITDDRVWGRGALDMKSQIAASLVVMRLIRAHGIRLSRDLLLVVTADEEAGSHLGAHWLWENHRDLIDAEIAFNEGGGQRFVTPGGPLHTVQVAEKGSARMRLLATGTRGHASIPRSDNAIFNLAQALVRLQEFEPPTVLSPVSVRMLGTLAELYDGDGAAEIGKLIAEPTWRRSTRLPIDPMLRDFVVAGLHNTAVPTILSAGERINITPGEASVDIDGRLLPGQAPKQWAHTIQGVVGDHARVSLLQGRMSTSAHDDGHVLDTLQDTLGCFENGVRILPYVNSASSDARALPGVKVFGFFPSASDVDYMRLIHGPDEHARISDLVFGTKCLLEAVLRLSE